MHSTMKFLPVLMLGVLISACNSKQSPGYEYMPDMYRTPSIKAFEAADVVNKDSLSALQPVEGTIPRGFASYEKFPNTPEGYEMAKANMKMPAGMMADSMNLAEGAKLYGIFCVQCHGKEGNGQGILVKNEVFLGVPSYADRVITPGSIFHVVTYGKGVMGSHAAQVTPEERWQLAMHVLELRRNLVGGDEAPQTTESDTAAAAGEMAMNNQQ